MPSPKILVVDDQLLNIRLLERKLEMNSMQVISCTNGPEALKLAQEEQPDVILLDIMMAGMNGIEVCRQLKKMESTREIPVIFITALTSKEEKIEGLEVGAADYVTKPLELDETLARVRTQMRIVEEHRDNIRLTQELEQSRRQASLMHLTEGIAHNMNNLLGVMIGYVGLLQRNVDNPEKIKSNCEKLEAAIKRMTRVVNQLTVIGHFKSLQKEPVPLGKIVNGAISRFHRITGAEPEVTVNCALSDDFVFLTNKELMEVCLERLLQNAYESYAKGDKDLHPKAGEILLNIKRVVIQDKPHVQISVLDRGKGINEDLRDSVFEPLSPHLQSLAGVWA